MTPSEFYAHLAQPIIGMELFDNVPDILYFIKDRGGRYVAVNKTLASRLGVENKEELVGKRALEVYPRTLGEGFSKQDLAVLHTGVGIKGRLELHLYPNGREGWSLTYKEPLLDKNKKVVGLVGITKDLHSPTEQKENLEPLQKVITHVRKHLDEPLRLPDLAKMVGLSVYQLDQRIRGLYHLSAGQFITHARIERACNLLKCTEESISSIALDCGYSDQSAFTRQFKQTTGITPKIYRSEMK